MSTLDALAKSVKAFDFRSTFRDLGWNAPTRRPRESNNLGRSLMYTPVAEAGQFVVYKVTDSSASVDVPITHPSQRSLRQKADRELLQEAHAHILIFVDSARTEAVFVPGKTVNGKRLIRERRFYRGGAVQPLLQWLAGFEIPWALLDARGEVSHTAMLDVVDRGGAFAERVSRTFYDQLKRKRDKFEPFLAWIEDEQQRSWYVTALLNRVMFIYFLQRTGLLGNGASERNYLRTMLDAQAGKGNFYRDVLLPLCFFGFGRKVGERERFESQFGEVPYLDGGLFELHQVEKEHGVTPEAVQDGTLPAEATIPDSEFRAWFDFFDGWRWTLDEENPENDGHINPSILGYIFEKYINQKQMGAYYTKEDITGYICRNTIIPRLFDMLAETGPRGAMAVAPLPIGPHPNLLNNGKGISEGEGIDRYIYPAVKTTDTLPTETPREFAARQDRYQSILDDFEAGKITNVNDFITYNLDMERMAKDFVSTIQDAEVLRAFYFDCLRRITVLDPTCGSGAFLFAALKILYPLYEACLDRMKRLCVCDVPAAPVATMKGEMAFANEVDSQQAMLDEETVTDPILEAFAAELARIEEHPNREYYILKTIIVNNLYGVDIMDEAVEICKLRLFLKLMGHASRDESKRGDNWGIEPLPDIDFNVLAGNALVGYTTIEDIDRLWSTVERGSATSSGAFAFEKDHTKLRGLVKEYGLLVKQYRNQQLGEDRDKPARTKANLINARGEVRPELDEDVWRLHREARLYDDPPRKRQRDFELSHRPFHWFLEFPMVMAMGGFDSLVGNPPYVEYSKRNPETGKSVADQYGITTYATKGTDDLFAYVLERSYASLARPHGRHGFIVPVSLVSTDGFETLRQCVISRSRFVWHSSYAERPAKLFDGVEKRLTIVVSVAGTNACLHSSKYHRWQADERRHLMTSVSYLLGQTPCISSISAWPKVATTTEASILRKMTVANRPLSEFMDGTGANRILYTRKLRYFVQFFDFVPEIRDGAGRLREPSELKTIRFREAEHAQRALAVLNSSLFFWFFSVYSDVRNVNKREFLAFPLDLGRLSRPVGDELDRLAPRLMTSFREHSERIRGRYRGVGVLTVQSFRPRLSKPEIDEIDRVLATHYGFTDEELDFIINYDIKYRMGRDAGEVEGE